MKAKYKILRLLVIFAMILSLGSCKKDFLQTVPTDAISTDIVLSSTENMMLALNGIHRTLYGQNGRIRYYAGQQYVIPLATDMDWLWYYFYNIIGSVNNIINAGDNLPMSDDLHNILGQCYTYRAWAHFYLVQLYGKPYMVGNPATDLGVPIMTATEPPYEGKSRNTVQEVYDQIKEDLNTAITHFADASPRADLSHLNIDVAKGIAARVYLTTGDWANAATYAHEARQEYSLMNESEYKSGFNNWSNPEWMWGSKVIEDQTSYYWAYFYYCSNNFNGSQVRSNPKFMNHLLYDQIPATDYRKDLILANAPSTFDAWDEGQNAGRYASEDDYKDSVALYRTIVNNSSRHNMVPYMHIKLSQADGPTITPMDVIHMRASEMYLIEAEALARQGLDGQAQSVLYDLVSARDAGYVMSTNTGQALINEILLQRRIELFLEGFRYFDMLRNDEVLDLTGSGADPNLYLDGMYQDRPSVNPKWLFSIPQRELNANPNMVQNSY